MEETKCFYHIPKHHEQGFAFASFPVLPVPSNGFSTNIRDSPQGISFKAPRFQFFCQARALQLHLQTAVREAETRSLVLHTDTQYWETSG
jgi:hypothetical protein